MDRNCQTEAVVLKTRRFGDFHKSVTMLSPEQGIIDAVAHGAYKGKSRMSSITDIFAVSRFDLYYNPTRDSWKINSCESEYLNSGIKENMEALCNASLWSEVVMKSHAAGADYLPVYRLLTSALRLLDSHPDKAVTLTVLFLYGFLMDAGFISDLASCGRCGRDSVNEPVFYSQVENIFICGRCRSAGMPELEAGASEYLQSYSQLKLEEALEKRLDLHLMKKTRDLLIIILKSVIEVPLKTLGFIEYDME